MKCFWIARLLLLAGGGLLLAAPLYPYTVVQLGSWSLPLRGVFLSGLLMMFMGAAAAVQALLGRGSLLISWSALLGASLSLWHDVQICTRDVGLALGRLQLSLSAINVKLIKVGLPPWRIVDAQQISHRSLELGAYLGLSGAICILCGSLLWLAAKGPGAIWPQTRRCACGQSWQRSFRFCPSCGQKIPQDPSCCAECGAKCADAWEYCAACGKPRR
ncbi:zinc ribbon domain-containing protein [bacterium]|nr:zinc ribbon domain-containing protein [bacterium]